ncbi:MAG: cellulose synthase subunit BcsC-related outer membrane protein [Bryobacterales bacterium]
MLRSRSGRDGFETLSEQQLNFETSTVIGDKFRLAAIARPTFLDAGDASGNTSLRLGLAPSGSDLGANTASGVGAEVQLSSENFGLKVGTTPDGFLVQNATLGLRLRPANGPFTVMFNRDVVHDTLLSYAGVKDPISGQIFGGVMSNALSLQGDWAGAESGVYARAGYQHLTGDHVQTNRRIDGGGGAWWRVLKTSDGTLTLGANLFGMKYDKNLRYFTLGHGGYFSPQRYVLFNIPVTWQGTYNGRFDYSITGGLGLQHIMEDDAPYFPLDASLQGRKGPVYTGVTQTGEHFSLRMDGGYRIAPHWTLGGFLDINNTRSYTNQSAGFYLRYIFREQPLVRDMSIPSLPDWTGGRQLGLP